MHILQQHRLARFHRDRSAPFESVGIGEITRRELHGRVEKGEKEGSALLRDTTIRSDARQGEHRLRKQQSTGFRLRNGNT